MVERAQAKRALERLVVHKDKFKSDSLKLPKQKGGVNVVEMMKVLLEEDQVAASCTAGKRAGLEQEVLESILDRTNVDHFKEKIKLADGKAAAQMLKEKKEAQKVRAERMELERKSANKFGFLGPRGPLVEPSILPSRPVHPSAPIFPEFIDEL